MDDKVLHQPYPHPGDAPESPETGYWVMCKVFEEAGGRAPFKIGEICFSSAAAVAIAKRLNDVNEDLVSEYYYVVEVRLAGYRVEPVYEPLSD